MGRAVSACGRGGLASVDKKQAVRGKATTEILDCKSAVQNDGARRGVQNAGVLLRSE